MSKFSKKNFLDRVNYEVSLPVIHSVGGEQRFLLVNTYASFFRWRQLKSACAFFQIRRRSSKQCAVIDAELKIERSNVFCAVRGRPENSTDPRNYASGRWLLRSRSQIPLPIAYAEDWQTTIRYPFLSQVESYVGVTEKHRILLLNRGYTHFSGNATWSVEVQKFSWLKRESGFLILGRRKQRVISFSSQTIISRFSLRTTGGGRVESLTTVFAALKTLR